MLEHESQSFFAVEHRNLTGEYRDTERAITLWHQKASAGRLPHLTEFGFDRLTSDWGYRFRRARSNDAYAQSGEINSFMRPQPGVIPLPLEPL